MEKWPSKIGPRTSR